MPRRINYSVYPHYVLRVSGHQLNGLDDIPSSVNELNHFLMAFWMQPMHQVALLVASKHLYQELEEASTNKQSLSQSGIESLLNYYLRFCSRATPFGLFAGVCSGEIIPQATQIALRRFDSRIAQSRIDTGILMAQVKSLEQTHFFREQLQYRINNSVYFLGDQCRYFERHVDTDAQASYRLAGVETDEVLMSLFDYSKRYQTFNSLVKYIQEFGYAKIEAESFIHDLIDSQLLTSQLEVVLSGIGYHDFLIKELDALYDPGQKARQLADLLMVSAKTSSPVEFKEELGLINEQFSGDGLTGKGHRWIQADSLCAADENRLSEHIANQVLLGIRISRALARQQQSDRLANFRRYFIDRFGDREVPLPEVIDPETGIGLGGPSAQQLADPAPLLDDLFAFGQPTNKNAIRKDMIRSPINKTGVFDKDEHYVELSPEDIGNLRINDFKNWPKQLFALFSILDQHATQPEIFIQHSGGGNPSAILSRFAFLPDPGIQQLIDHCIDDEIDDLPDCIIADIQFLPEDRAGNILQRPHLYRYELPLLAQSLLEDQYQVRWQELMVRLDGHEVVLWSPRLQKKILPKLPNAHNYLLGKLDLYKFLVEVGLQHEQPSFNLPEEGNTSHDFVPGIRYKNILFRPPEWRFHATSKNSMNPDHLRHWFQERGAPNRLVMIEGDRDYYLDWRNDFMLHKLCKYVKNRVQLRFHPFLFKDNLVKGTDSSYANQFILCFHQTK